MLALPNGIRRRDRFIIPGGVIPKINWAHPLTKGLFACYVPGVSNQNLTGKGANLTYNTAALLGTNQAGAAMISPAAANGGAYATVTAEMRTILNAMSIMWYGTVLGPSFGNSTYAGICYQVPENPPYQVLAVSTNQFDTSDMWVETDYGGGYTVSQQSGTIPSGVTRPFTMIGTSSNAGAGPVNEYKDGVFLNNANTGGGNLTWTATSSIEIGEYRPQDTGRYTNCATNVACYWNRMLTAAEVAIMDRDPTCFLIFPQHWILEQLKKPSSVNVFTVSALANNSAVAKLVRQSNYPRTSSDSAVAKLVRQSNYPRSALDSANATAVKAIAKAFASNDNAVATNVFAKTFHLTLTQVNNAVARLVRQGGMVRLATNSALTSTQHAISLIRTQINSAVTSFTQIKTKLQSAQSSTTPVSSLVRGTGYVRTSLDSAVGSIVRQVGKVASGVNSAIASRTNMVGRVLAALNSALTGFTQIKTKLQPAQATTTPVSSTVRSTGYVRTSTNSAVTSLVRAIAHKTSALNSAVATRAINCARILTSINSAVTSLSQTKVKLQAAQAVNSALANLVRGTGYVRVGSNSALASVKRATSYTRTSTNNAVASVVRAVSRILQGANSAVASFSKADLGGTTNQGAQASTTPVASTSHMIGKQALASNAAQASKGIVMTRGIAAIVNPIAALLKRMLHSFSATTTPVTSLSQAPGTGQILPRINPVVMDVPPDSPNMQA